MKRSAAIIGPTPQFVRWAISHPCPIRQPELEDLPKTTFQQLRSLRALSDGYHDNRVHDGVCFHSSVTIENASSAKGILLEEITALFGEPGFLSDCCKACPANALEQNETSYAGCFGFLAADSRFSLSNPETFDVITDDIAKEINRIAVELDDKNLKTLQTQSMPVWNALWCNAIADRIQLECINNLLGQLSKSNWKNKADILNLYEATNRCLQHELALHVELIPQGHSDGQHWTLVAHCPKCKIELQSSQQACPGCQREGAPEQESKRKVLGLRPYLRLSEVFGEEETIRRVQAYFEASGKH